MPQALDLTGQTFSFLTVERRLPSQKRQTFWLCRCVCGREHPVETRNLRRGQVSSCGCKTKELQSLNGNATHRLTKSPTYKSWSMMKSRCSNPNYNLYEYYGGSGISVCEAWGSFEAFLKDMGLRPEGMTLDRKDPDGNYDRDNCRWATQKTQAENKRSSLGYTLGDETKNLNEWAEIYGTTRKRLYAHMYREKGSTLSSVIRKLGLRDRRLF